MADQRQTSGKAHSRAVIIGGGAAGFFAAITCAENAPPEAEVLLLEKGRRTLSKVKISGGGRCNVTHACFEPKELIKNYPRGGKSLLGSFFRWQPRDTVEWFESRGVDLKTESDGRMFPVTDDSQTIIDCLETAARRAGARVLTETGVQKVDPGPDAGFTLTLTNGDELRADALMLATGGGRGSGGYQFAGALGHELVDPVPSLFTFHVKDPRLADLSGVSVAEARVTSPGVDYQSQGPVLITHWGLSGPGILKLSAWGAREFAAGDYRFPIHLNWLPGWSRERLTEWFAGQRRNNPKRRIRNSPPEPIPQRLWQRFTEHAGIDPNRCWTEFSRQERSALIAELTAAEFSVTGKSMFKEEFVTAGGVARDQVDFKTLESRVTPGLFFAGELLDVDGVTGGFNFQAAWTTGHLGGLAMAARLRG